MTIKDWRVRIEDMLEAMERIRRYAAGMTAEDFCGDDRTVDAVVRNLEILGEAAHRVPPEIVRRHPEIPWHRMAEMRNILIHEYHAVDAGIIWATLRHDLPPLAAPLRAILAHEQAEVS